MSDIDDVYKEIRDLKNTIEKNTRKLSRLYQEVEAVSESLEGAYDQIKWISDEVSEWVSMDAISWADKQELNAKAMRHKSAEECSLYYITNAELSLVKIGISGNVKNRAQNMQTSTGYYLELVNEIVFSSREKAMAAETYLHDKFGYYRRKPDKLRKKSEWFDICILDTLMRDYKTAKQIENEMERIRKKDEELLDKVDFGI
jgi:uncharacterized protein YoxC